MKAVFLGTPETAVPSLRALLEAGVRVPLVVTQPDRPRGRSGLPRASAVKQCAVEAGLPVVQPSRVRRPEFVSALAEQRPDLLVVVAYGRILPLPVLEVGRLGAVNLHFSMLPAYRGAAPVQWALARGETSTGVTTMRINERLDEGDILLQREVTIRTGEHAPSLGDRLARVGADLLVRTLEGLERGTVVPQPQDPSLASHAPLLRREDGEIDPSMPATEIEGRIRGFDPWPGVWLRVGRRRIRLLAGEAAGGPPVHESPGTVIGPRDGGVALACGLGSLLVLRRVQAEGRRPVDARDALHGRLLVAGDRLEAGTR